MGLITPAQSCVPTDERTNRDFSVTELTSLQASPDANSAVLKRRIMDEQIDASIDESTPVRELCRSGDRSFVRILLPEELRSIQGWVPSSALRETATKKDGSRSYTADYFEWPPELSGQKALFVKMANRITDADENCEAIDPVSPLAEPGKPGHFSLLCVGANGSYPVEFTKTRIIGGTPPVNEDVPPIAKLDAYEACRTAIEAQLVQPKTVDFHISDTTFGTEGGRARYTIAFTSNNGLGLPIDATGECVFVGETLTSAAVIP